MHSCRWVSKLILLFLSSIFLSVNSRYTHGFNRAPIGAESDPRSHNANSQHVISSIDYQGIIKHNINSTENEAHEKQKSVPVPNDSFDWDSTVIDTGKYPRLLTLRLPDEKDLKSHRAAFDSVHDILGSQLTESRLAGYDRPGNPYENIYDTANPKFKDDDTKDVEETDVVLKHDKNNESINKDVAVGADYTPEISPNRRLNHFKTNGNNYFGKFLYNVFVNNVLKQERARKSDTISKLKYLSSIDPFLQNFHNYTRGNNVYSGPTTPRFHNLNPRNLKHSWLSLPSFQSFHNSHRGPLFSYYRSSNPDPQHNNKPQYRSSPPYNHNLEPKLSYCGHHDHDWELFQNPPFYNLPNNCFLPPYTPYNQPKHFDGSFQLPVNSQTAYLPYAQLYNLLITINIPYIYPIHHYHHLHSHHYHTPQQSDPLNPIQPPGAPYQPTQSPFSPYQSPEPPQPPYPPYQSPKPTQPPYLPYQTNEPTQPPYPPYQTNEPTQPPYPPYQTNEPTQPPYPPYQSPEPLQPPYSQYQSTEPTQPPYPPYQSPKPPQPPYPPYQSPEPPQPPYPPYQSTEPIQPPYLPYQTPEPTQPTYYIPTSTPPLHQPTEPSYQPPQPPYIPTQPSDQPINGLLLNPTPGPNDPNSNKVPNEPIEYSYETEEYYY